MREVGSRGFQTGASLIEFALVLPVFLLLVIGVLYASIAFVTHQAVAHAAQRGADAAISADPNAPSYATLAVVRASLRVAEALSFLPGEPPEIELRQECDTPVDGAGNAPPASYFCVIDSGAAGGRMVSLSLAPAFSSLWPQFPRVALAPLPAYVRATGAAVVPRSDDGR
ncbi:hypothetical protein SADO_04720 [Salinisphaera dokdonensis CL-ES53]|uniref:TadE-like domain-containing protein n=1 Tax=Salinisphaera dokdonensis CL-ES53 TaxID=1304272 RepID=A0ABV2AY42_9GAMM